MYGHDRREIALDVVAIALVPIALAAVHFFIPQSTQLELAFQYDLSEPLTLFTAAYIHASDAHLLGNVVGYLTAVGLAYQLCLEAGRRRWFHHTFVVFLVVLPILVNVADYFILTSMYPTAEPLSRGFSGVAAGFAGFVFIALLVLMRTAYDRETVFFTAQLIVLLLFTELLFIYGGTPQPTVFGAIVVGFVSALWMISGGLSATVERTRAEWETIVVDAVQVGLVIVMLSYFVFVLFPSEVISDGTFTNIFAHGIGLVLGSIFSAVIFGYLNRDVILGEFELLRKFLLGLYNTAIFAVVFIVNLAISAFILTLLLVSLSYFGVSIPALPDIQSAHPIRDVLYLFGIFGVAFVVEYLIERVEQVQQFLYSSFDTLWTHLVAKPPTDVPTSILVEYNNKRKLYTKRIVQHVPVVLFILLFPFPLLSFYFGEVRYIHVSIIYLSAGVGLGAVQSGFSRTVVPHHSGDQNEMEVEQIIANQIETILLLAAAAIQFISTFDGISVGYLLTVLLTVLLGSLFIGAVMFASIKMVE